MTPGTPSQPSDASGPLLRMARFFLVLPQVEAVRDIYAQARALAERKLPITRGEERLLRQVTWCMLQVQDDQLEGELHRALALIAALTLAVIEDDELELPDGFGIAGRLPLESLAVQLRQARDQLELAIGAAIGMNDVVVAGAADLDALEARLPQDEDVQRVVRQARIFLRQGEELIAKQADPERAARQRERHAKACERTVQVVARLLAFSPPADPPVVRANLARRELKRIEVDALGVEVLTAVEQSRRTRELLAWTEADLGEAITDDNRAELAARIRDAAASAHGDDDDWLSEMN